MFLKYPASLIEVLESRIAPATFTFVGGANATWNSQASWHNETTNSANGFPGSGSQVGIPDDAVFTDATSATVTLSAGVTIHSISFSGSGSPTVKGAAITFTGTSSPFISVDQAKSPEIDSNIILSSNFPLELNSDVINSNLTLTGVLSDGFTGNLPAYGGFAKTGPGALTLSGSGANTFPNTGAGSDPGDGPGFFVEGGLVSLNKTSQVAISSDLGITSGTVIITGTGQQIADTAKVTVDSAGLLLLTQSETVNQLAGTGTVNGSTGTKLTLKADSNFAGSFGSTGTPTQFDLGLTGTVLTLSGTEPDLTTAKIRTVGGVLNVSGDYPHLGIVLTGPGGTDVGVLTGTGSVGNVSTTGAGVVAPGTGAGSGTNFGTLSVNDLSPNGGSPLTLQLDVTSTGHDTINLLGTLTQNSVAVKLNVSGPEFSEGQVSQLINVPGGTQLPALVSVVQGGFGSLPEGTTVADAGTDFPLVIHYNGGDGNDVVLVAEPNLTSITPTFISPDGKTATFLQEDGDMLTLKTTKGKFTAANFTFGQLPSEAGTGMGRLQTIDVNFADFGTVFQGASITGTVNKGANGDGFANIGAVDATGVDLAGFTLRGDLGQIDAGDANVKTTGLGTLSVLSLAGISNLEYTAPAQASYTSTIVGKLGTLSVSTGKLTAANTPTLPGSAGVLSQAFVDVIGDGTAANNKFAAIGKVTIDNVNGNNSTGVDEAVLNGLTVAYTPGTVRALGPIGPVLIKDGLRGGSSKASGEIWSRTSIASVTIPGSTGIMGGDGQFSGGLFVGSQDDGSIRGGKLGAVKIAGSISARGGIGSAQVQADGGIGAVTIGGSVDGDGASSGSIISEAGITSVTIKGHLQTRGGRFSGSIVAFGGNIGAIKVGNLNVFSDQPVMAGIFANGTIASVNAGSMTSLFGEVEVISAFGKKGGGNAIGSVKVTANVDHWDIAAGYDTTFDVTGTMGGTFNPDASIGTVTVGGTFSDSAITAGTLWGSDALPGGFLHGNPQNPTDSHLPGDLLPKVLAKIAQITIAGQTSDAVFEAQVLTGLKIAGVKAALTTGVDNLDLANFTVADEIV